MKVKVIRTMARFGTLSPVIGGLTILLAKSMNPAWSISQPLLALGEEGFAAVVFNSGLLMAGSLAMIYAAGLFEYMRGDKVGQIGSACFLIYAICTCLLGAMMVELGGLRPIISGALFAMVPLSQALISYALYGKGLTGHSLLGLTSAVIGGAPWIMDDRGGAVYQLVALASMSIWEIALGVYLQRLEEPEETD